MTKKKLLVTSSYDRAVVEQSLLPISPHVDVRFAGTGKTLSEAEIMDTLGDAEILIAAEEPYTNRVFAHAPGLRMIARDGVGYNNIDLDAATRHKVTVTNAPVVQESVADLAVGLLLAMARRITVCDRGVRRGAWKERERYVGRDVYGATLGVIGFGRIGQAVARRARGFDMRVLAHSRTKKPHAAEETGAQLVSMDQVLGESDFVVLCVPLTAETNRFMNAERIAAMKGGSYLINVSRGAVVDETALIEALRSSHLAGAGLDVFTEEPPPPENPLLTFDTVVLAPHAGSDTLETFRRVITCCVRDIGAVLAGGRPVHLLNPAVYEALT